MYAQQSITAIAWPLDLVFPSLEEGRNIGERKVHCTQTFEKMSNATVHVRAEIGVSGHSLRRLGAHFLSSEQKVPYLPNYPQKVHSRVGHSLREWSRIKIIPQFFLLFSANSFDSAQLSCSYKTQCHGCHKRASACVGRPQWDLLCLWH